MLGREIDGRIANLRKVDFTTGGQNFVLVLSPGLIDKAPHSFLATVRVDGPTRTRMYMAVTDKFPNISTVRVKDAIAQVRHAAAAAGRKASAPPAWSPFWRDCWCWPAPSRPARAPGCTTPPC